MKISYVIVLGCRIRENGPGRMLKLRLDRAVRFLDSHPRTICIVSGGKERGNRASEARIMKQYLIRRGVSADRIRTESSSLNTFQNMRNCRDLFDIRDGQLAIITSDYHMPRSLRTARKVGWTHALPVPAETPLPAYLFFWGIECLATVKNILKYKI